MYGVKFAFASAFIVIVLVFISYSADSRENAAVPPSFNQPAENLLTGGQPTQAELAMLKAAGITKIINLRGAEESISYDEQAEVEALGMTYSALPVAGAGDVTTDNARALYQLLQGDEKVFVHCASGNRVGALLAIGAHEINGKPVEEALEFGRAAGLSSLEPKVKAVLTDKAKQ
ncbi:protein tyrosine phosphatase family protein [Arsukibacterium sp. UBA3155]|uniref:protein tyrosine phosphatase family protein n=1 Tax=Arsukibacterium sp. UBA3155 TaxID=1946058 RepID=UPI0025C624C8|nr:protein tyrosine phosphatase family protein [Arsukibacterium sp. UBA3155]